MQYGKRRNNMYIVENPTANLHYKPAFFENKADAMRHTYKQGGSINDKVVYKVCDSKSGDVIFVQNKLNIDK